LVPHRELVVIAVLFVVSANGRPVLLFQEDIGYGAFVAREIFGCSLAGHHNPVSRTFDDVSR
jgi:hypothetical protein